MAQIARKKRVILSWWAQTIDWICGMQPIAERLSMALPSTQELKPIFHLFSGQMCNQAQQAAHLFTDAISLLLS
jgi:hypothetical protein